MTKKEKVLGFMENEAKMPLNFEELAIMLSVPADDREELYNILEGLLEEGKLVKTKRGRYQASASLGILQGVFIANERGFGFVDTGEDEDIFIPKESRGCALDGDTVIVKLDRERSGIRRSGKVERVIKMSENLVVCEIEKNKKICFAVPDSKKFVRDIYIAEKDSLSAKNGDKVLCRITSFKDERKNPEGKVVEILGKKTDIGMDILSIAKEHGLRTDFPEKALAEAKAISQEVDISEAKKRRDLTDKLIITIDGDDAKDLDDAVSLEIKENGNFLLGVHIADVGHYVKLKSPLDKEAFKRGTSVYLTDRVIPMLPFELSNGICSLNPNSERLALSVEMEIDDSGKVLAYDIFESVIKSKERMTYGDVTAILEGDRDLCEKYGHILTMLENMNRLREILYKKRRKRGSIDFDFPEAKVILDEKGRAKAVEKREITVSNQIIEEFMLITNETVSEHMFWQNVPFLYRVHEAPSEEKIASLCEFIALFGYGIKRTKGEVHSKEFQKLTDKIKGTREERIIQTVMLRSMQKARYTHECLGHFGLGAKYYSHFTSPIRRYPDLVIHRIIKESLKGKNLTENEKLFDFVQKAGVRSSDAEITAMEAERDCRDMKMAEYMSRFLGAEFEGVISSVTSFGMFIELENTVEGFISLSDLDDDYYIFDEKTRSLSGERYGREYKIGDAICVVVAKADKESRRIDFIPVA